MLCSRSDSGAPTKVPVPAMFALLQSCGPARLDTGNECLPAFEAQGPAGTGFLFRRIVPWPRDPVQVPGRQFYRFFGVIAGVRCFMRGVGISMLHAAE